MPNNTKARSKFLFSLAVEIAAREKIDPINPPHDNRMYINEIAERGDCHRETARRVWAKYLRRALHPYNTWGGTNRGQGRKKTI